jgi:ketosteroid isomerase-like protein
LTTHTARYFAAVDARDWDAYRALYADTVVTAFAVLDDTAGQGAVAGLAVEAEEIVELTKKVLSKVTTTQHIFTNVQIAVDGDTAVAEFYEQALHYQPSLGDTADVNSWIMYGHVRQEYQRTPGGWVIFNAALRPVYDKGNRGLLDAAARGE